MKLSRKVTAIGVTSLLLVGGAGATAAFASEPAPASHHTTISAHENAPLKGQYTFYEDGGQYNGEAVTVSSGYLNFDSGNGHLTLANEESDGVADMTFTNIAQNSDGTITMTAKLDGTTTTQTVTMTQAHGLTYKIAGAGLNFSMATIFQK